MEEPGQHQVGNPIWLSPLSTLSENGALSRLSVNWSVYCVINKSYCHYCVTSTCTCVVFEPSSSVSDDWQRGRKGTSVFSPPVKRVPAETRVASDIALLALISG